MEKRLNAENVRFSRFLMTLSVAAYALFGYVVGIYLVIILTLSTIFLGSQNSISSYILKFLSFFGFKKIFKLDPRYDRSFDINREMVLFEETLRLIVVTLCLIFYFYGFLTISTFISFFMAVMMLISSYFGFCMSGLIYILYQRVLGQKKHV